MNFFIKFVSIVIIALLTPVLLIANPNIKIALSQKRTALVIGNSNYKSSPLKNPVNDATDIAHVLKKSGFKVTLKVDASQREMEEAVRKFGKNLRKGGIGLFYYAGHGIQVSGRNYLIPVNANIETESDIKYETLDAGRILGKMEDAGNGLNIIILDACRNNPFARSFRSSSQGLARMDAPKGSLIAYATGPGSVAADGEGRNGIYTKYLVESMQTPGLTVEEVLKNVRISVVAATENKQVPWESSSLMVNFYFFEKPSTLVQTPTKISGSDENLQSELEKLEKEKKELEKLRKEIVIQKKLYQEEKQLNAKKKEIDKLKAEINLQKKKKEQDRLAREKKEKLTQQKKQVLKELKAKTANKPKSNDTKPKLAVFPFIMSGGNAEYWKSVTLEAIEDFKKQVDSFDIKFSSYNFKKEFMHEYNVKKIDDIQSISNYKYSVKDMWYLLNGKNRPQLNVVCELAQGLGVDIVLMGILNVQPMDPPNGSVSMFLIDVPVKRSYYSSGHTPEFDGHGYNLSINQLSRVCKKYDRIRTKRFAAHHSKVESGKNNNMSVAETPPSAVKIKKNSTVKTTSLEPDNKTTDPVKANLKTQMALFPFRFVGANANYWKDITLDAIKDYIKTSSSIEISLTSYDFKKEFMLKKNIKKIPSIRSLSNNKYSSDDLWYWKYGQKKPKVDIVCEIAKLSNIDIVLMAIINIQPMDPPNGSISLFIVDVASGTSHYASGYTAEFDGFGYQLSMEKINAVFNEYSAHQPKNTRKKTSHAFKRRD